MLWPVIQPASSLATKTTACGAFRPTDVECVAVRSGCDQTTVELRRSVHRARTEPDCRFAVGYAKPAVAPEGSGVIEERESLAQGSGNRHRLPRVRVRRGRAPSARDSDRPSTSLYLHERAPGIPLPGARIMSAASLLPPEYTNS